MKKGTILFLAAIFLLTFHQIPAYGLSILHSETHVSNFSISPQAGTIVWTDFWYPMAGAIAFDIDTGSNFDLDMDLDFDGEVSASASTLNASASSDASSNLFTINTSIDVNWPTSPSYLYNADADTYGELFNTFMITGGAGDVDVDVSLDYSAVISGYADWLSVIIADYEVSLLISDGSNAWILESSAFVFANNESFSKSYGGTLSDTWTLEYDTYYSLLLHSEPDTTNNPVPEPGTFFLLGAGLAALFSYRKKIRNGQAKRKGRE